MGGYFKIPQQRGRTSTSDRWERFSEAWFWFWVIGRLVFSAIRHRYWRLYLTLIDLAQEEEEMTIAHPSVFQTHL